MNEKPTQSVNSQSIESAVSQTTRKEGAADDFLSNLFDRLAKTRNDESRVPRKIGTRTRIVGKRRIGIGGLGAVYEYWDRSLDRPVALKVIKRRSMESETRRKRFLRERELTAQLQHPAIPSVFQSGELRDGRPYYLMQRIQGKTLHEYLRHDSMPAGDFRENQDLRSLLDAFLDVCDAVHHAHSLGIVHRDIKPANIMIDDDGAAYLVDWGLARNIKNSLESKNSGEADVKLFSELTQDGHFLGSPDWMSPEQAKGDHKEHGIPTDIYGLGATLYHILSGYPPHTLADRDISIESQMSAIATNDFLPADARNPSVPAELSSICSRAMSQNPADRYQTAAALKQDLRAWIERLPVEAHRGQYSIVDRITMFSAKHRKSVFAGISMLLVIVVSSIVSIVMVNQSARAAEEALSSEREANQRLFTSLEAFADTIMSDDVLAVPELQGLRNRVLTDLSLQYETWAHRPGGTPQENMRAAMGTLRLAQIEHITGNLHQAMVLSDRAVGLANLAIRNLESANEGQMLAQLKALRVAATFHAAVGDLTSARRIADEFKVRLDRMHTNLGSTSVLEEQALFEHLQLDIAYRMSNSQPDFEQRHHWVRTALNHAGRVVDRRQALVKLGPAPQRTADLASALNAKALMHHKLAESEHAIKVYNQALALLETANPPAKQQLQVTLLFNAVMSYRAVKDHDAATDAAKRGLEICRQLHENQPLVIRYREELGRGFGNYAEMLMRRFLEEEDLSVQQELLVNMRNAAQTYEAIYRDYPDRIAAAKSAAVHYLRLSACLHWAGRDEEALAEFEKCLDLDHSPQEIEPGHQPNAYATVVGHAVALTLTKDESHLARLENALQLCTRMLLDQDSFYQDLFIKDSLFDDVDSDVVKELIMQLDTQD